MEQKRRGRPKRLGTGTPIADKPTQEAAEVAEGKSGYATRGTGRRSWKPANMMAFPDKDPNFSYKFAAQKNVRRYKEEGWQIVEGQKNPNYEGKFLEDGSAMDTCVMANELVLMRLPKELAEARKDYHAAMTNTQKGAAIDHFKSQAESDGVATYEPKS